MDTLDSSQGAAPLKKLTSIYNKLKFKALQQKLKGVKYSTSEESTNAGGTIITPVIEIDTSTSLVKRELFISDDVESSSSPNESAPWVRPLPHLSTSEDVSEQTEDASLVPCIPLPATVPIRGKYEGVNSINFLISQFVAHIGGVDGGMRKHPESYGLAVKGNFRSGG